ncbi:MAG: hypothetical protein A2360_03345 [Candidatus Staskawiczbacteria bacterium RIFOXYB1_FULL_32_11]|uniref:Uncharacterized protein n=1 Tax=Candidatus Staskawiczbacteria bacterium RIFOXYD1_FULL_32_13 TaxID=1802234 RepID=A0A1G2JRK9_9BACT|nr:MAG: hypothetical protein UR22_C0007G0023 [Parcubacteria group bacterium GW2011_GWC2_32_10]OGZ79227.1 MAG: hypothetical protein A2256_04415 [Candidatus Staskawiczbacteria bacterium RIFOXYA2_FULL_32_7]OGZ79960.1 MAG: hypothetical protein A2360_03345 [Candidatus Staskawiczbacteria bacterium RIFOXYB1_FULL_32_11]OGZ86758.1 MAG: hypothetical protein A2463_03940 [Candidatus Staskawiczbacteria bacterium RIFOXYC2_FULL_32_10]OGZ89061.1 MAG: hypothetical protein A2561_05450 [Candidatus Staskawiczbacte
MKYITIRKLFIVLITAIILPCFVFAEDLATTCKTISETENGCSNLSSAECKATLEKCEAYYEAEAQAIANDMTKTAAEKKTLTAQITNSKKKILGLETQIKQGTIKVKGLNLQIGDTKNSIDKTSGKIIDSQTQIANILRSVYQENKKSIIEILIEGNVSDFFSNLTYLEGLNSKVSNLLESTQNLKSYLEGQKIKMDDEVGQLQKTIALQNLQKKESEQAKKESEQYLKLTEAQYQEQLKEKQEAEKKVATIRAKLFEMVGVSKAPTFGEALEVAKSAASLAGVRPAFLLAVISQESAIGKNVGQCVLVDKATGTGKRIKTGATVIRVMKPTRDVLPFVDITTRLGKDPLNTPISCWIPVYYSGAPSGWGGAMGPAQFIPSTWMLYDKKLKTLLGRSPDPWGIKDSFTASGLYLADLGASAQTASKESNAASRYYGGSSAYSRSVMRRATCIQGFIDNGTMSSDCQGLIF